MAKYYERIKALEAEEDARPVDRRAIDDSSFEFDTLKAKGLAGKLLAWLIQQRWFYALLRICAPVRKMGGIYFVTRYEDVAYVRTHDDRFEAPYGPEMDRLTGGAGFLLGMRRGARYDDQFDCILNGKAGQPPAFQRKDLDKFVIPHANAVARQLLKASAGEIDVIADYLNRIAVETCCRHYGLEPEDPNAFAQWLMSLSALLFADYPGNENVRALAMAGAKRIHPVTTQAIEQARFCLQKPAEATQRHGQAYRDWISDTVIGRLVAQQLADPDQGPSDDDIRGMIIGLAVGFVPTGAGGGGGILEVLLKRSDVMRHARIAAQDDEDETLERILLEAMRFKPPILPGLPRYVVRERTDADGGGNKRIDKIPAGATILAASFSAMFDGRKFGGSIKRFDENRTLGDDDLSFGGADLLHYCFGEQIFRKMITIGFKHLLRCDGLKPEKGKRGRMERTGPFPVHLHMTFTPDSGERDQSMLTICVPLPERVKKGELNDWLDTLGNPAGDAARAALMNSPRIHFAQMTAIGDANNDIPATLLVEINADGSTEQAIESFVSCLWNVSPFQTIMSAALNLKKITPTKVIAGLSRHNYALDIPPWTSGKGKAMGLNFFGLPEQSVALIESEKTLANTAREALDSFLLRGVDNQNSARDAVAYLRRQLKHMPGRLGAQLVRPQAKDPAVARHPTRPLMDTLGRVSKEKGLRRTFWATFGALWFSAFVFLQGGLAKGWSWEPVGHFLANIVHLMIALLGAYGLHWARFRLFGAPPLANGRPGPAKSRLWGWAIMTTLAYVLFAPIGFWGDGPLESVTSPDYASRLYTLSGFAWTLLLSAFLGLFLWLAALAGGVFAFRNLLAQSEAGSPPADTDLELKKHQEIMHRENQPDHAQNHIVFTTPLKDNPSWLRRVTMFIGFYFIKILVKHRFRKGFVLDLGTIHFARWFILPNSHTMVFYSNYDGSGESYFEDFVTKARWGQTGVWSNGKGFPRTKDLLFEGAKDATRFKRWIRHHQQITRFWFARFKDLSTRDIRRNAMICEGLAKARTDSEYRALIDLMTSRPRPHQQLETEEIQSLILRGMGNLKASAMLALKFPAASDVGDAALSRWLADLAGASATPSATPAAFDRRLSPDEGIAVNVAVSPSGLKRLRLGEIHHVHQSLPSDAFSSLPAAFRSGMVSEDRKAILGDTNHGDWHWGASEPDAVLLIYATDKAACKTAVSEETNVLLDAGFTVQRTVFTKPLKKPAREPFGFVDGVSQPVIKGMPGSQEPHQEIHVVEPGEIVLGYRDNTEYYPTSPMVNALSPGAAGLPSLPEQVADDFPAFGNDETLAPRDLGKNGSFLVIRQLEQDEPRFTAHLDAQAAAARDEYGLDYITADWLGAKLMGRWKDGSSILSHPYKPRTETEKELEAFKPSREDNAFLFGAEDPQAQKCPFGAHIRRANPRDSQNPTGENQVALSNRHRLLRRGRVYEDDATNSQGLLFMCLNANLERQYEFVQQTWLNATRFHGLHDEYDSIAGASDLTPNTFTVPTPAGPIRIKDLRSFVTMRGGGYFFMPSRSALRFLSVLAKS